MVAYIKTYGCQMNLYDAEIIKTILGEHNYTLTSDEQRADILMLVTCSVRKHAETRALGRISSLRRFKHADPSRLIVVTGCMAQNLKSELIARGADIVVGPDQYRRIPELIARRRSTHLPQTCTEESFETYGDIRTRPSGRVDAFVAIMRGCDNFCSYCIVPQVRGRERSKRCPDIIREVQELVRDGVREITLVGQNVLAYRDGDITFSDLLEQVDRLPGYDQLRFLTSHPRDLTLDVLLRLARLEKICPAFHLPFQSGSNRILSRMNRGYTAQQYLDLVGRIRDRIPDAALSTDVIVGFPGETDDDFRRTMAVVDSVRFDSAFFFKYSPRAGTRAADLTDDVPPSVKQSRLTEILSRQEAITGEINRGLVGTTLPVLVVGTNRRDRTRLGRTRTNKLVAIKQPVPVGRTVTAVLVRLEGRTFIGEPKGGQP